MSVETWETWHIIKLFNLFTPPSKLLVTTCVFLQRSILTVTKNKFMRGNVCYKRFLTDICFQFAFFHVTRQSDLPIAPPHPHVTIGANWTAVLRAKVVIYRTPFIYVLWAETMFPNISSIQIFRRLLLLLYFRQAAFHFRVSYLVI